MSKNAVKRNQELIQKLKAGTTYDRIYAHYIYPKEIELSEKEKELCERWSFAWTSLLEERITGNVIEMIRNKYDVSTPQAYRDVKNAKKIFGDVNESTKQAERNFLSELALETFHEAAKANNFSQMNKAIANLIKLKGLDKDEPDAYNEENMKSHNYYMIFSVNGELSKLDVSDLDNMDRDEKMKLQQILEQDISDVESTNIMES